MNLYWLMTGIYPDYNQIKKYNPREKLISQKHLKPNSQETLPAFSKIQERVWLAV